MCLAIPGKVVNINDTIATVEIGDVTREASILLVPEVQIDDYVLLHAGFAIQKIDEDEAIKTLDLLRQMDDFYSNDDNFV
jgi:hydrogenase expression/formation protein HypC